MATEDEPQWLDWAKRLRTMAQNGLTYTRDPYDIDRYHAIAGIAHAMIAQGVGVAPDTAAGLFIDDIGHATPKLDVRTAAFREGPDGTEVLVVRERSDGLWTLPGGWADIGESPSQAAAREVLEESGYRVRITRLLALWDKRRHPHPPDVHYIYKLFFAATILGTDDSGGDGKETDGVGFFARDRLPPLSVKRTLASQIQRVFDLHAAGDGPAAFD
jgi:ADP-ribose pyrophosphatase YjhB (NUDIX family)